MPISTSQCTNVTSWYDIFLHGGLTHYCGLRQRAVVFVKFSNLVMVPGDRVVNLLCQSRP
jgi:hypothetical protein